MAHLILAVLVPHTATTDSIDGHLAGPLRPLLATHTIDSYRRGGACTGRWDPSYDPSLQDLQAGHRRPEPAPSRTRVRPNPVGVAVVDAHH